MRLNDRYFTFIISFFVGVAWATLFIGAITTFLYYYQESLFLGVINGLLGALPGLFALLVLEHIITVRNSFIELQKQTKLLESLQSSQLPHE
jgi:cytochrome c biogenesis protein CcdA